MLNSFTSSSDLLRLAKKAALFVAGLLVLYPATLFLLANIPAPDFNDRDSEQPYSLYQFATRNFTLPGGFGYTLTRYREIEEYENIDILLLGSSRCYYSFAPHVFERLGLSTFNMGTPSQTPLNTRFLLEKYYDRLNPKLVVFEINLHILQKDGLESFLDLMVNSPVSVDMARMSLATGHPAALNAMTVRALAELTTDFADVEMQPRPMDSYLGAGAVSASNVNREIFDEQPRAINIPDYQWEYLAEVVDFVQERGAQMILVVAPIPSEWEPIITNYDAITGDVRAFADAHGVRYYDFNRSMQLDSRTAFKDFHHLNAQGAKLFSYDILDSLMDVPIYRSLLNIDPLLAAEVYAGRGLTLAAQGDFDKAIADYRRALALVPTTGMVHYNLARACQMTGRTSEAIAAYRNFIKYLPEQYTQYVEPVKAQIALLEGS